MDETRFKNQPALPENPDPKEEDAPDRSGD